MFQHVHKYAFFCKKTHDLQYKGKPNTVEFTLRKVSFLTRNIYPT